MQTLEIDNKEKDFILILGYDKDGVHSATIKYNTPVELSKFINCGAIAKTSGCGGGPTDLPAFIVENSHPSDAEGRRL